MAHITADRVRQTSTSTGTGSIVLSGSIASFRDFSAVLAVNDTFWYAIASYPGSEWEVGLGTYTSASTFTRTTVLSSSNAGSAVTFSAGTKEVFITAAASKFLQADAAGNYGNFSAGTITAALTGNATTATTLATARNINGVSFNGSADVTITAAAGTLTGTTLNSTVVTSSLTSVGTLTSLSTSGTVLLKGAAQIAGSNSAVCIAYSGAGTQYGITLKPDADATTVINIMNAAGTSVGSISQTATSVNFNGNATTATSVGSLTGIATVAPLVAGTAAVGTSTLGARQDHVHPAQTTVSGNAGTATTLATARSINGTSFNGSADVTIGRIYDTSYRRITNPGGAEYVTTTASVTGAIAITLPVGMTGSMVSMTIKVYEYVTNESFEINCGGYNYATGSTWANSPFAYIVGSPGIDRRFTVRFGYDSVGLKAIIYIGELASTWSYPQVFVTDAQVGFGGQAVTWTSGWTIGFETTAFNNVTATITNPQVGYAVSTNTANSVALRDASGNFSAGTITAALTGNATTATALATSRTLWGQGFTGAANVTGSLTSVGDITGTGAVTLTATANTLALAATGANSITASTNGSTRLTINSAGNVTLTNDLTVSGTITSVKNKLNTVTGNLGNPTVEEMALFHGQFNNKFRFLSAFTQEESTDGVTWTTSTRATANQLADIMLGEGQVGGFNAIPAMAIAGSGYYRLTWDQSQTGYVYLNALYIYCSTQGNNVTFTVERQHNTTGWETVATSTTNVWPGHIYIPHTLIPFSSTSTHYGKVRISFVVTSAATVNSIQLNAIEWFGGYPAGKRNVESYDRLKNVTFPAEIITPSKFTSTVATGTAPLAVASTTVVTNLNADLLDGYQAAEASTISTVAARNSSGDINVRLVRQEYTDQATISGGMVFRVNNSSDNYLRVCNDVAAIRTYLGAYASSNPSGYTTNTGTVTSVTGTAPVVSSGGTAPAISMAAASSGVDGYMTGTYATKLDGIAAGATANTGTVTDVSGTAPIVSSGGTAPAISISAATTIAAGSMSSADKTKLDGIAAGATANTGTVTGVTATSPVTSTGGTAPVIAMPAATATVNGYMTSTFASKLNGIAAGATAFNPASPGAIGGTTPSTGAFTSITATGNITAYSASDVRLKENISDIESAVEKVLAIGGKTYEWTDDYIKENGGVSNYLLQKQDFGVIAQDVQKVFPIAVRERENGQLAVDYVKLVALSFAAIKEQEAKFNAQQDKINQLEQLILKISKDIK